MTDHSPPARHGTGGPRADEGDLIEVEFSALQAVQGGWGSPIPTPPPPDPSGGFCGTRPRPGPFPIVIN